MATKQTFKTKSGRTGTYYKKTMAPRQGYTVRVGKSSGKERYVRDGSRYSSLPLPSESGTPSLPDLPTTTTGTQSSAATPGTTQPSSSTQSVGIESLIGTSLPGVDTNKIAKDTKNEYKSYLRGIGSRYDRKIGEASEQFKQESRALRGQLGTGRRFSSSAEAFMNYIDTENAKKLDDMEKQKEEAMSAGEFEIAQLIETRIANERANAQQEFNNAITAFDLLEKEKAKTQGKPEDIATSEKQASVIEAMSSGLTDIEEIFNSVRASGQEDITLEDITTTLEEIGSNITGGSIDPTMADKLTGDAKNFLLMKSAYPEYLPTHIATLPEGEQLGAYMRWVEGAPSGKVTPGGVVVSSGVSNALPGTSGYDRDILIAKLGKQIYGKTISDAEGKRVASFIETGMKNGKSELQIIDDVLGFKITRNQPLAEKLRNSILSATDENGLAGFDMAGLARLINDGNEAQAVQKVEQFVYSKAKALEGTDFVGESSVRYAANKSDEVRDLVYQLADVELGDGFFSDEPDSVEEIDESIGNFSGTMQNWLGRFKSEDAAAINTAIVGLVAEMRNKLSGTAVTESEARFLEPLIPRLEDKPTVFLNKLMQLKSDPLLKLNNIRATYNLPALDDDTLNDYAKRVPAYMAVPKMSDDDFFNNPIPATGDSSGTYDPSVWNNAP